MSFLAQPKNGFMPRRLAGLTSASLPSPPAPTLHPARSFRTLPASSSVGSGSAALRWLASSSSRGRGTVIPGRAWRGSAKPGFAPIHCRLVHSAPVVTEDKGNRMVILGKGMIPLDVLSTQELRNEVDRLERAEHAVIQPRRYCSLLVSCTNPKLRARVLRLADKVTDVSAANSAAHGYALIFHTLWKSRVLQRRELDPLVATILSTMRDQEVPVNGQCLNYILNLYFAYGDVAKACDLFDLLREGEGRWRAEPNVMTYTTLVRGLAGRDAGGHLDGSVRPDLPRALRYFEQMVKRDGVRPDRMAFTALLHVCAAEADLPRALQVWDEMNRAGIAPDTFAFNSLLHVCNRALDLDLALKLTDGMQSRQLEPNDVTYSSLIDLCCRVNDFGRAHELLNEMKERGIAPTVITYTSLISAYGQAGDVARCFDVLALMAQERVRPNQVTLAGLVQACLNAGDFRKAVQTLGDMKRRYGLAPSAYVLYHLIHKAGPNAKTTDLLRLLERIEATEGVPLETRTYSELIKLCGTRNELELAFLIHEKAQQQRGGNADATQRLVDRSLFHACVQNQNPRKALEIVDAIVQRESLKEREVAQVDGEEVELDEENTRDPVDVTMFNALLRVVDTNTVESVIDRMKRLRVAPNMATIDLLITHYESSGRLDRMWAVLRDLQDHKVIEREDLIYNSFIKVFLRRDDTDKAYTVFTELLARNTPLPPATYHLFLDTRDSRTAAADNVGDNGVDGVDDGDAALEAPESEEERAVRLRRVGERVALIPNLVQQLYERDPSAPPTALLPFIRFCVRHYKPAELQPLVDRLERDAGRGAALVERIQEEVADRSNSHRYQSGEHVVRLLAPVLKAYIMLHEADRAIELIHTLRQRGLKVDESLYNALVRLATPESPGSALRLRALMRADRIPDEDTQDPFAPLELQPQAARPRYSNSPQQHRPYQRRQRLAPDYGTPAAAERPDVEVEVDLLDPEGEYEQSATKTTTTTTTREAVKDAAAERKRRKKEMKLLNKEKADEEGEGRVKKEKERAKEEPSKRPTVTGDLLSLSFSLLGQQAKKRE